jgi:signal transduction histidine kinase
MGMGLFIVNLIAEQNGGGVRMESEPGKGTTATIFWPES